MMYQLAPRHSYHQNMNVTLHSTKLSRYVPYGVADRLSDTLYKKRKLQGSAEMLMCKRGDDVDAILFILGNSH
jgi:hypothetical protein